MAKMVSKFPTKPMNPLTLHQMQAKLTKVEFGKHSSMSVPLSQVQASRHFLLM